MGHFGSKNDHFAVICGEPKIYSKINSTIFFCHCLKTLYPVSDKNCYCF